MRKIKRLTMYTLAKGRRFANTPKGERVITQTLTSMTAFTLVLGVLLIIGLTERL